MDITCISIIIEIGENVKDDDKDVELNRK